MQYHITIILSVITYKELLQMLRVSDMLEHVTSEPRARAK
jgi:hypothetical protein